MFFVLLHHTMSTFFATFAAGEVVVQSVGAGQRDLALDGKVSDKDVLFRTTVTSRTACATACVRYDCCFAFTTSLKDPTSKLMTCRGYPRRPDHSSTVSEPGSKTYFVKKTASASSWLERPCRTATDCPAPNSTCFQTARSKLCLCTPGFYYSLCRDSCVPDCPQNDLQQQFLVYPLHFLENDNFATEDCLSVKQAQLKCLAIGECRSFNLYSKENKCYIKNVTALHADVTFRSHTYDDHYQRTCQ